MNSKYVMAGMTFGMALGAGLGAAVRNVAFGIGLGVSLGTVLGAGLSMASDAELARKKAASEKRLPPPLGL